MRKKKLVDTAVYGKWPGIDGFASNDGAFYCYYYGASWTVLATNGSWQLKLPANIRIVQFTGDSKRLICQGKDSLFIRTPGSDRLETIPNVSSYFRLSQTGNSGYLLYKLNTPDNPLMVRNLSTGKERSYSDVTDYELYPGGGTALLQQQSSDTSTILSLLQLDKGTITQVWKGKNPAEFQFSTDGKALAFIGSSTVAGKKALWYYKCGDEKAQMLVLENSGLTQGFSIQGLTGFNNTGDRLLFKLEPIKISKTPNPDMASVDVYSYKDPKLQFQQLAELDGNLEYTWCYNLSNHRLFPLEGQNEHILSSPKSIFVLVRKGGNGDIRYEWNWNKSATSAINMVSTADGQRRSICRETTDPLASLYQLSPSSKYLINYDPTKDAYLCENVITGAKKTITKRIHVIWQEPIMNWALLDINGPIGWTTGDRSVLLAARYDIYQVDPEGKCPPISLTNGIGRKRHLTFDSPFITRTPGDTVIDPNLPVILHFTSQDTKEEGFYRIYPESNKKPELLSVFPKKYIAVDTRKLSGNAGYVTAFLDESHPENYYLTTDFKTFMPLTDLQRPKGYNWLTSQLVTWKTPDGKTTQGILYKPEDFDSKKKYPLIFQYYEEMSWALHNYYSPNFTTGGDIDIPTYVSNGYLVFLPDIHYRLGHPGESARQTIASAAKYLSKFLWVDHKHMGLMGHSWGGFETNYVITHSHLFAAAVSMSGPSDFVSNYNSHWDISSSQCFYETGQGRIRATLWQRPDLYLENSPVFRTDKVTTPVLIMANKQDYVVPYEQGFEFFTALRRLGKKAWLLQYDNGGHNVYGPIDSRDITVRTRQFFDYYLKGITPPKWMVEGIPASQKQIESGYEADTTGKQP